MRKSGVNNINFGHNAGQQQPPMSPDNMSQPMGTMVGKRQSQHVNSVGMSNGQENYNYQTQDASMRASGNHWNSPN